MHDPKSVAFEIPNIFIKKDKWGFRPRLITIWHCDPEKDGSDDSCGRFIRQRHIDPEIIKKVRSEFEFNFKHNYWFKEDGTPQFSVMGTVLEMYSTAAWIIFTHQNGKPDRKRHRKFMRKYLYDILHFGENPTDSLSDSILQTYGVENPEHRINSFVSCIVADIFRKERKWYQDPKWHVHHWEIQFHPFQDLKRRYWDKCSKCGKRGFKGSAITNWSGSETWHQECDGSSDATVKND
jgi:hypothetical protein